jgi:hypothetical protein
MKADISTLHKPDILILRRHTKISALHHRMNSITLAALPVDFPPSTLPAGLGGFMRMGNISNESDFGKRGR